MSFKGEWDTVETYASTWEATFGGSYEWWKRMLLPSNTITTGVSNQASFIVIPINQSGHSSSSHFLQKAGGKEGIAPGQAHMAVGKDLKRRQGTKVAAVLLLFYNHQNIEKQYNSATVSCSV
eukprot:1161235-Pelagomonas_calceolata.AAC.17